MVASARANAGIAAGILPATGDEVMMTKPSPIAFKLSEVPPLAGVGRTSVYEAINSGELRAVKRGKSTLILADDLRRWLEQLPAVTPKHISSTSRITSRRGT